MTTGVRSSGFTLLEVLIVLALVTISLTVTGVAFARHRPSRADDVLTALRTTRSQAIRTGRVQEWREGGQRILFFPDGSSSGGTVASGGGQFAVAPLTGAIHAVE